MYGNSTQIYANIFRLVDILGAEASLKPLPFSQALLITETIDRCMAVEKCINRNLMEVSANFLTPAAN